MTTRLVVSPRLVGRSAELELLAAAVSSPPAVVVIEGEAGIGKTRLVSELRDRPEASTRRFLVGSCRRIREPFPLGPVIEAVRVAGESLAAARLSPVAGSLRTLLPEIADSLPPQPEPLDDRAGERHRVFRGLVEVLGRLGPTVLVLEDLHWADEQTVDFVSYLLGEPPRELSVVLTFRGEEVDAGVRALTAKLPTAVGRARVALTPLDARQTGALAAAVLGVDRVSDELAAYLCERASGLPFAIEELLALLRARGTLVRRGSGWARKALEELDVPTGIRDSVLERIGRFSPDARSVVEAAAVLQAPAPVPVLLGTCRVASARALRGLDEALESGLFAEQGDTLGFRHPLAAQAVYEGIPGPRRRELHGRAAATLRLTRPVPLGQLAHHLRHAGQLAAWVDAAELAADQAVELGHDAEATRLLDDVLRTAPLEPDRRGRIAVKLGRAALETVHVDPEVAGLLAEVLQQDLPAAVRGELRLRLALLLHNTGGDPLAQRRLFAAAIDDLGDRPDLKAWAMVALCLPMTADVAPSEQKAWMRRLRDTIPEVVDPTFKIFLLGKLAMALVAVGDAQWRRVAERIVEQTGGTPRRRHEVNAYWSVGLEACCVGDHETADLLLTAGLHGTATCESPQLELRLRSALALLDYCRGSWDGLADEAAALLGDIDEEFRNRPDVETAAGCLALARGDLDDARRRLAEVVDHLDRLGAITVLPLPAAASVRLAVASADPDAAVATVHRLLAAVEPNRMWGPAARALPAMVHALATAGRSGEARGLLDRVALELAGLDAPLAAPALRHAGGYLDAAALRWDSAARHFLAAAELYEPLRCPYEAAQARESAAVALSEAGDAGAADQLRGALATYQRLGATWDLDRAANTARRLGVSVPARHRGGRRGYGTSLSPREQEVAELAAIGRTNKEIAADLFLSVHTVERHVTAAMRKLGVHSRHAITRSLGGGPRVSPDQD